MADASSGHKSGSSIWPPAVKRAVKRMLAAAASPPKTETRRWTIMGLK